MLRLTEREDIGPRQRAVAALIAEGLADGAIDRRLGMAPGTTAAYVEAARRRLERRLRVHAEANRRSADVPARRPARQLDEGRPRGAARPPRPTLWRRLAAALVSDTRLHPSAAGARARATEPPRLRYAAGGIEIDLEVGDGARAGRVDLLGQVTTTDADLERAGVAVDGPSGHREARLDELGQFALEGLAHGPHRLEVRLVAALIEIPDLRL